MAGIVADYQILSDGRIPLRAVAGNDTKQISFDLPGRLKRESGTRHSGGILSFGVFDSENLDFELVLNGSKIYDSRDWTAGAKITSATDRSFNETFPSNKFSEGDNNLTIQVNGGKGTFHDVIVWFQRGT
ncbi:MAG: hypothetical protein AAFY76_15725 [Cyanobacteria bacterium J06649_11]